jgi:hypothetical protein
MCGSWSMLFEIPPEIEAKINEQDPVTPTGEHGSGQLHRPCCNLKTAEFGQRISEKDA